MQPKTKNIQNVSEQTATKYPNQTMKPCGEPKSEISYMEWFLQPLAFEIYNLSHCFTVLEKQMLKKNMPFLIFLAQSLRACAEMKGRPFMKKNET